jgi:fructuronate reductase
VSRLSYAALSSLPASVRRPAEAARTGRPGIVHLGIGAFHRAHMAVMTQAAMEAGDADWRIIGASLRSPDTRDALGPQDGLYTLAIQAPEGERLEVVSAVADILVAPEDPARLIELMADPMIRIVSMTVTEKGYCHDPATGALNERHPDVLHDLENPATPRSAPGFILAALARRRARSIPPFAVLCCDNLPSNGRTVRRVLSRMASLMEEAFGDHVRTKVACPCTMVDRIVPATSDADRDRVSAALAMRDAWPVMAEPFSQWVVEDDFPLGRPRWEVAGAEFVRDVAPFEQMKLRLLNGAHSSLAYLGLLLSRETVAEASADPQLAAFLRGFWAEVRPTVPPSEGTDLEAYCARLLERFRNPAIRHRLAQIAMDGSQKLPQRLLGPVRENIAAGRPIEHALRTLAAFALHAAGHDGRGRSWEVRDPLAAEMARALDGLRDDRQAALDRFLGIGAILGEDLPRLPGFRDGLGAAVAALLSDDPLSGLV